MYFVILNIFFFTPFLLNAELSLLNQDTLHKYYVTSIHTDSNFFAEEYVETSKENITNGLTDDKKKVISSTVVALVIILVALTPKLLLIRNAKKGSKKNTNTISASSKAVSTTAYTSPTTVNEVEHHNVVEINYDKELRELAMKNDPLFLKRFEEVYYDFTKKIMKKHPDLIRSEFSLCAMIFLNFTTKEIAEYTFIQVRSVQTNRSRLRKKMQLSSSTNLDQYIRSFR